MEPINKDFIFQEIPLFAGLNAKERVIINKRSELAEFKKGQIIYKEGSPADALYCIVSGRVVIYTIGPEGREVVLEYLHRGKYFGVISLLTGESHSVTSRALNDCSILIIKKEDFDYILNKIPRLAIDLSRTLSRRLKRKDVHQKTIFESTVVSVYSSYTQAGKTVYALNLALSLKKETQKSVVILDIAPKDKNHTLPKKLGVDEFRVFSLSLNSSDDPKVIKEFIGKDKFGVDLACFYYDPGDDSFVKKVIGILSLLVNDYHYLVLDLPTVTDRSIFGILNQSDLIHILTSPDPKDLRSTSDLISRMKDEFSFYEEKIKVVVNEYKRSDLSHEEEVGILGSRVFATLPKIDFETEGRVVLDLPQSEYSKAVRRISRVVGDCQVGLVLGIGVAYGFCHVGVLKVIEEEKIPVDVIAGSSIGALIATLWAVGYSSEQILEITKEFSEPKHIWGLIDLTFPHLGFIKGNKLYGFLKKHLGDKTFYDVRVPLKVIASDVKRKEPKVFDKGLLVDAVMASCAMPGVFTPFKSKEELLFDGGVTNPLPTEALLKVGVKKIIAVNVTPSRQDILKQYEKIKQNLTVNIPQDIKRKNWFNLKERFKDVFKTNILDIIFSSVEILQSEVAEKEGQLADIVLHPDTSGLYWLELHRAQEFAKRGEDEARKNLPRIRQVINE